MTKLSTPPPPRPLSLIRSVLSRSLSIIQSIISLPLSIIRQQRVLVSYILIALLLLSLASLILLLKDLPAPADLSNRPVAQTTKILDRHGKLLYNIYVNENRTVVPLEQIPPLVRQATIAIEDKDFYRHGGINIIGGILRALRENITGQGLEGGSTITQQLIKISLLTPERTLSRKIKEAVLAFWTERIYSKDQILAMYLNRVPYGGTAYGIEEAAQFYFRKNTKDLNLAEAALLAGLPAAPTYYSPFGADPGRAVERQKQVLRRLYEDRYISKEDYIAARKTPLAYASPSAGIKAPHFVAYVREQLVKKYGETHLSRGGLKVTTTLDLDLQEAAQASLSAEVARQADLRVGNGAALITRPPTGEILAMIGSADYFASPSGKVNVTLARRSPGSALKPLTYAAGFLKGIITPATPWIDAPFCFPEFAGKRYCPQNYDGKFHGVVQTRFALGSSLNIPATKALAVVGLEDFLKTASLSGISTFTEREKYGYSLTLGAAEVTMTDMAAAFGVFANAGRRVDLNPIIKTEDNQGKVLEDNTPQIKNQKSKIKNAPWDGTTMWTPNGERVLPAEVAYLISHILLDDAARELTFGPGSILNIPGYPVSVKTGTTENKRDNWTIGYTPSYLVAVWVGNNDNSPMSPFLESGNTGAAPIWRDLMRFVLKETKPEWPQKPSGVVFEQVCSLSGMLPANDCPTRGEYFIKAFAPSQRDNIWNQKQKVFVYKDSHKQPGTNEQPTPDQLTEEDHMVISDPLQKSSCADCPPP